MDPGSGRDDRVVEDPGLLPRDDRDGRGDRGGRSRSPPRPSQASTSTIAASAPVEPRARPLQRVLQLMAETLAALKEAEAREDSIRDRLEDLEDLASNGCYGERLSRVEEDVETIAALKSRSTRAEARLVALEILVEAML